MIYIGPEEHSNWGGQKHHLSAPEFVAYLVDSIQAGVLPATNIYTVTVAVPQSMMFNTNDHPTLTALLDELDPYVSTGYARYATYSEVAAAWQSNFDSRPVIYHRCANPPRMTLEGCGCDTNTLSVSWMGLVGSTYTLETTTDLLANSWSAVHGNTNMAGRNATITRQPAVSESKVVFRVIETIGSGATNRPVTTDVAMPAVGDILP